MRNIVKSLVIAGTLMATGSAVAELNDISPYIGVDYYQPWMRGKGDWNLVFPKTYPGATLYVGTKFHEFFGLELGYDWGSRKTKNWVLPAGSPFMGNTLTTTLSGNTKIRRSGGHLDLVGFLPVAECLELTGSVGFGWVQPKITSSFSVTPGTTSNSSALASVSGKGRGVFRVGVGASYMVTEMVGVRAKVGWEGTSTLRVNGNALFTSLGYDKKAFKGTTAMSVGAFVKF